MGGEQQRQRDDSRKKGRRVEPNVRGNAGAGERERERVREKSEGERARER